MDAQPLAITDPPEQASDVSAPRTETVEPNLATMRRRARQVADPNDVWDVKGQSAMTQPARAGRAKRKAPLAPVGKASGRLQAQQAAASPTPDQNGLLGAPPVDEEGPLDPETATEALVLNLHDKQKRGRRTVEKVRKKQRLASEAVAAADNNPALGALNRHLNLLLQQLTTAHRLIGRVAAERDALRQQLADLQGVPVEQIQVTNVAVAPGSQDKDPQPDASQPAPLMARLNYFGHEDLAVARKRRQSFVLALVMVGVILAVFARQIGWSMPEDVSKGSLSALPIIGNLMSVLLAGWVIFRVFRMGSKGVKWVFPSERKRRRR